MTPEQRCGRKGVWGLQQAYHHNRKQRGSHPGTWHSRSFEFGKKTSCEKCLWRLPRRLPGGFYLYHETTPSPNSGHFKVIFEGWSQNLPWTKLFPSCSPWIWTSKRSWRKRYSNAMRMQNQAKLAAGAYRGHMAKYMVKCLHCHWSVPADRSCHLGDPRGPPNMKLLTENSLSPKISPPPIHNFGLCYQVRKPPLPNPSFPMRMTDR